MEFRLLYQGQLKANGSPKDKQAIRRIFHPQLRVLWNQPPLSASSHLLLKRTAGEAHELGVVQEVGGFSFAPLVCSKLHLVAHLEILFLRPEEPGKIITQGGDLDNRLKTLFDSLRMPKQGEIPKDDTPNPDENPFLCLLEDDSLITNFSVTADRLLEEPADTSEVLLIICVKPYATVKTWIGLDLGV